LSYIDALEDALADLNFPVLYDADIGHRPPQMTILNGSLAQLSFEQGTGLLIQSLV
jgi:muramoyltetrapeptide carboxypeptidase LdcA involved in peptidoglycan recycling